MMLLGFDIGGTKCAVIVGNKIAAEAIPTSKNAVRIVPAALSEKIGDISARSLAEQVATVTKS